MTKTRFAGLGFEYVKATVLGDGPPRTWTGWQLFDISEKRPAKIGPDYRTKDELLADLENQANMRGYPLA